MNIVDQVMALAVTDRLPMTVKVIVHAEGNKKIKAQLFSGSKTKLQKMVEGLLKGEGLEEDVKVLKLEPAKTKIKGSQIVINSDIGIFGRGT